MFENPSIGVNSRDVEVDAEPEHQGESSESKEAESTQGSTQEEESGDATGVRGSLFGQLVERSSLPLRTKHHE